MSKRGVVMGSVVVIARDRMIVVVVIAGIGGD